MRNEVIGEAAATESHRVQPGDTYQSLSMMYYGDARFAVFLMRSNPQISGGRLQPGQVVKIPPRPGQPAPTSTVPPSVATRRTPPASTATSRPTPLRGESATAGNAARSYTVREGDSFYAIARDVLGNAARWQELFELNRDAVKGDPKRLRIGQVIQLPES